MQLALAVFLIIGGLSYESAPAADVAEVVGQVSKESYTNYLRNDLYTHDGDQRCSGPQQDLAQQRIRELFESFGLETSLHPFAYGTTTCYNVVGVHRGISCPSQIYVLGAHYDSVAGSPGALDNGSGVAGLLESARVLSQHAFEGTIVFIAFDREEQGLKGSFAYANDHIRDHIHGMLNLDCIAPQACGPEHPDYNKIGLTWLGYPESTPRLLDDLTTAVESYTELTCVVHPPLFIVWPATDHMAFGAVGFAAVGLEPDDCSTKGFRHTGRDSVDQLGWIDYDHGTRVTQAAVACLATLAMLAPARIYPDFDGDRDVDIEDCVLLIEHWRGSDSQFDIAPPPNGDGVVNDQDLSALLHYWFSARSSWWDFDGNSGNAGYPVPADGATDVLHDTMLTWDPGDFAQTHDVYLATVFDDVNNASRDNPMDVLVSQGQDGTTYETPTVFECGQIYYWRIDEVEADPNIVWKGPVWSFTTSDFILLVTTVDDFEIEGYSADIVTVRLYFHWRAISGTGSVVGPFLQQEVVHSGRRTMVMTYSNVNPPHYSEAARTWQTPQDWTIEGADTLTLYFRGRVDNGPDPLYVVIEDEAGRMKVVTHPDANAVLATEWQAWHIALADLEAAGVDISSVTKMYTGVGDRESPQSGGMGWIYIDDIAVTKRTP